MPSVNLTQSLRDEYQRLFDTCNISADKLPAVENIRELITNNQERYAAVGNPLAIPWYFIAAIHSMEASLNFKTHLHNGDPLTERTVHVPQGRPKTGEPPFTWEESAADALKLKRLDRWSDWSLPGLLYKLEEYNGWGYRLYHPEVLSPYLWSFSNHYTSGKYVADGTWSDTARSKQAGAAMLLRRLAEKGDIEFQAAGGEVRLEKGEPLIRFSNNERAASAEDLQRFLNKMPGIYVREDGYPGDKTSEALKKVTGYYLLGDPRAGA